MCNKCHARITGAVALEKLVYLSHMGNQRHQRNQMGISCRHALTELPVISSWEAVWTLQSLTHVCFEPLQLCPGNQVLPSLYSSKPDYFPATFSLETLPITLSKTPNLLWAGAVLQGKGKIIVIIGETCSGDDNDNNFLKVSFQSCLSRFKSKSGRRTSAGVLCRHESKSKAKRTKRKAEIPLDYIFIPPSCLSVLMGDNRHLFPVNVSQLTGCAAERTGKGLPGVCPWPWAPGAQLSLATRLRPTAPGEFIFPVLPLRNIWQKEKLWRRFSSSEHKNMCPHSVLLAEWWFGSFFPFLFF